LIKTLHINNYALIKKLQLSFENSFITITGETGAGKSILLGALSLLLGSRADKDSLRDSDEKCIIEAEFDLNNFNLESVFVSNDLDYDKNTIIRREITKTKTRAFINDTPVNLKVLNELKSHLVDIHSQSETNLLSEVKYQYEVLDKIANNHSLLLSYRETLRSYKKCQLELISLQNQKLEGLKKQDYNQFLFEELEDAKLYQGIQDDLENEFNSLQHAEDIQYQLSACIDIIQKEDFGTYDQVAKINQHLNDLSQNVSSFQELKDRIQSTLIEIQDIGTELENKLEDVEVNPERLQDIEAQYQKLNQLLKKHQLQTDTELIDLRESLEKELLEFSGFDNNIEKTKVKLENLNKKLSELSIEISESRKQSSVIFEKELLELISQLGMENASLKVDISEAGDFNNHGKDEIKFMFSANKGMPLRPLSKVASGGEMSRIMLGVKSILARYESLPSIIFDEIDTGVSGEVALKMGEIMKKMSKNMQVISITHLPQIASKGNQHLKVLKSMIDDSTETQIKNLSKNQRIEELSQMLGGTNQSKSAVEYAKNLLN